MSNESLKLHPDLLFAVGVRLRGQVMWELANAFVRAHKEKGTTFFEMAKQLDVTVQEVEEGFELKGKDEDALRDVASLIEALDHVPVFQLRPRPEGEVLVKVDAYT